MKRTEWLISDIDDIVGSDDPDTFGAPGDQVADGKGNLYSSLCEIEAADLNLEADPMVLDEIHMPVIDIDHPCRLVPSSTEGHFHLYVDVPMTKREMLRLLDALVVAGVVEEGFAEGAHHRGMAMVRKPGVKKGDSRIEPPANCVFGV